LVQTSAKLGHMVNLSLANFGRVTTTDAVHADS